MRRLGRFLWAKARDDRLWDAMALGMAVYGTKHLWERTMSRLDDLEAATANGTVPLDDVATMADVDRAKREVLAQLRPDTL